MAPEVPLDGAPEDGTDAGTPSGGPWPESRRSLRGVVEEFDDDRGLGTVSVVGGRRYRFHCTAVADGSRHVEVGAWVRLSLAGAHGGTVEARDLAPAVTATPELFLEG